MNQPVPHQQSNIAVLDEAQHQNSGLIAVESSRAVQEVQASLIIAKRFPRDEISSQRKIMNACQRPGLAEVATYTYSRGGSEITGPSIRLAEAIAQYWGNIDFGWREIDRKVGTSTVQAYCWDKETNTRREMTFDVKHIRDTKQGGKILKDERDIYENNANMAARRMRACILAMIPGDIIEDAVNQCDQTLKTKIDVTPERRAAMVKGFKAYGVTKAMIEARIQRLLDAITPTQFLSLGKIANSLRDGMSKPDEWFDFSLVEEKKSTAAAGAAKADEKKKSAAESAEEENKDQLEGFKKNQAAKNTTMAEKLEKAEKAVAPQPKKVAEKKDPSCATCNDTGILEDAEGKGPCPDCQGKNQ